MIGGGWRDLADAGKLRLRGVDGGDVAGAGARVVHIAGAESATDGPLGNGRTGKADARSKVVEVRIDKRFAVDAAEPVVGVMPLAALAVVTVGLIVNTVCEAGSQLETRLFCSE